jgi:hypothetical protein
MLHIFCMCDPMKKKCKLQRAFNKAFRVSLISPRGAQTLTGAKVLAHYLWCFFLFLFGKSLNLGLVTVSLNFRLILLPQVNGWACVDFGCTHLIDGLFWSLLIYLLGNWFNHASYHFYFCWVVTCLFVSQGFMSLWNLKKYHMTNSLNEICLINIQTISFTSFKFY